MGPLSLPAHAHALGMGMQGISCRCCCDRLSHDKCFCVVDGVGMRTRRM